jgi:hypothetical protein
VPETWERDQQNIHTEEDLSPGTEGNDIEVACELDYHGDTTLIS